MTKQSIYREGSPFSEWLRKLSQPLDSSVISNHNLDYIWHNYRQNWLILIEEKQFGGHQTFAQHDTHSIVDQMLHYASEHNCMVKNARGKMIQENYRGYYLVVFENTNPEDSTWISINGRLATKQELYCLLSTGSFDVSSGAPAFIERRVDDSGNGA